MPPPRRPRARAARTPHTARYARAAVCYASTMSDTMRHDTNGDGPGDFHSLCGGEPLAAFGLALGRERPDLEIPGSPERCLRRWALEDGGGGLWVLERLFGGQRHRREAVARVPLGLDARGLPGVPAYRPAPGGHAALECGGAVWQLAPYFPGEPLPRPEYIEDAERGASLAAWLCAMRRAAHALPAEALPEAPASRLPAYVDELLDTASRDNPEVPMTLAPVLNSLDSFFEDWEAMPRALCHGDFHPLNVIWRGREAAAVVDWEFTGLGPALYDAANMLGCVGSEDPTALGRGLCAAFVDGLRKGGLLDDGAARHLAPLVVAARFAWLSEWLRRGDEEMVDMELAYMRLLANSRPGLERVWGLA